MIYFINEPRVWVLQPTKDLKQFASNNKLRIEQSNLVNHVVAKFVILSLSPSISTFKFKDYFKVIRMLKKSGLDTLETNGLRFLYGKHIQMYNFSKLLFPIYFRFNNK